MESLESLETKESVESLESLESGFDVYFVHTADSEVNMVKKLMAFLVFSHTIKNNYYY